MKTVQLLAASLLLTFSVVSFAAPPAKLTPEQAAAVEQLANRIEQQCLRLPDMMAQGDAPPQVKETMRTIMSWGATPQVCSCQKDAFIAASTSDIFTMNQQDVQEYFKKVSLAAVEKCAIPVAIQNLGDKCEQLFGDAAASTPITPEIQKRMDSIGVSNPREMIVKLCGCVRPALKKMTPKEYIDSSLTAYKAYQDRVRTGDKTITAPPTAIDSMMNGCFTQLQEETRTARQATTPPQANATN